MSAAGPSDPIRPVASPRLIRALPISLVVGIVVVGLLWIAAGHWRKGAAVVGSAAAVAAILRLVVPGGYIGPLGVRSRLFDVLFLLGLAVLFTLATTVGF